MARPLRRPEVPVEDLDLAPPRWRVPLLVVAMVAVFVAATIGATRTVGEAAGAPPLPRLVLPSVAGMHMDEAEAMLTERGFSVNVEMHASEGTARGTAFGQRPEPGAKVLQGDLVTVMVSDGESGQPLPDVAGRQVSDAQMTLVSGGFVVAVVPVPHETVPPGEVIAMSPAPGRRVVDGAAVTLSISAGPAPRVVPAVEGRHLNEVMVELGRAGLGIGTITRVRDGSRPAGTVLGSEPGAGSEVPRDYPVALRVVGPTATATVPHLVGVRQASAEAALRAVGLGVDVAVRVVATGDPQDGRVTSQSVPGGLELARGAVVRITVSSSGAPPPPTAPMVPTTVAPPPPGGDG